MKNFIETKGGLPNCVRCQASTRAVAPAAAEFSTNSVRFFSTRTATDFLPVAKNPLRSTKPNQIHQVTQPSGRNFNFYGD